VGGRGETPVSVRVVALTHRDLERDAETGRFRRDLFHRLASLDLHLPALRDRREDIPRLAGHFLGEIAREVGKTHTLTPAALTWLCAHPWPGNVRELRNVLRRAILRGNGNAVIDADALERAAPVAARAGASGAAEPTPEPAPAFGGGASPPGAPPRAIVGDLLPLRGRSFKELEREIFLWALRENGGSRRRAARALGISRSTFCDRVKRLGLSDEADEIARVHRR
jgi:DNA-binding NtrC family response regulator